MGNYINITNLALFVTIIGTGFSIFFGVTRYINGKLLQKADKEDITRELNEIHRKINNKADLSAFQNMSTQVESIYNHLLNK